MRNIKVFSLAENTSQTIRTDAVTWGEVLEASSAISSLVMPDMKIVIKETKGVIESREAELPQDRDLTIYLTPGKVKSGDFSKEVQDHLTELRDLFVEVLQVDLINLSAEDNPATVIVNNVEVASPF